MLIKTNLELLSDEAKKIVQQGYGFRDDGLFNDGITDFSEVMHYEIMALGNNDILETLAKLYGLNWEYDEDKDDMSEDMEDALELVQRLLGKQDLYCKWLCDTDERVRNVYQGEYVEQYDIKGNWLIASDIGQEGILVVSDEWF